MLLRSSGFSENQKRVFVRLFFFGMKLVLMVNLECDTYYVHYQLKKVKLRIIVFFSSSLSLLPLQSLMIVNYPKRPFSLPLLLFIQPSEGEKNEQKFAQQNHTNCILCLPPPPTNWNTTTVVCV